MTWHSIITVNISMFELEPRQNLFITLAKSFSRSQYIVISACGAIFGTAGVYAAWLDSVGRYEELGIAFFAYVILQLPVFIAASGFPRDLFLPLSFAWWFSIGSFIAFFFVFLIDYFRSINPE